MNRREFVVGSLAASATAPMGAARAQSGPLTKIIFPFAAGGSGDMLCRQLAEYLPAALDRKFIVENRTGADGLIGIRAVKGAAPDTATVLVTTGPTSRVTTPRKTSCRSRSWRVLNSWSR
jgi:tripartite-type tricarboxylate transporter receptor subunit TctC